jgi:hypothetical protein
MPEVHRPLILDLVEWIGKAPRPYEQVMEVWRTSCPRLPVWEDAVDAGYLVRDQAADGRPMVSVTEAGRRLLRDNGR